MALSFPLTFPSSGVTEIEIRMINAVASTRSPTSGQQYYQQHSAQYWEADIKCPKMDRATAAEWQAFLASLQGRYGTFLMGEPEAATARGVATGTPLVNGASQTGNVLVTDGWTISTNNILRQGDFIQIGTHMYMILKDVNSDGSGNATLDVWPNLRSDVTDNAAITVSNPKCIWRLDTNTVSWRTDIYGYYTVEFSAVEGVSD